MFVCDSLQHGQYAEKKTTEKNLIVRSGRLYLKPKQLIIKDCARRFVLKQYRHEASHGDSIQLLVSKVGRFASEAVVLNLIRRPY